MDYGVSNDWPSTMRSGWAERNRAAARWLAENYVYRSGHRVFVRCDAHPSQGGPHLSRGVYVGEYHGATLFACTHRSRRGSVCGAIGLEL